MVCGMDTCLGLNIIEGRGYLKKEAKRQMVSHLGKKVIRCPIDGGVAAGSTTLQAGWFAIPLVVATMVDN